MAATDQTYRNQKTLDMVFAVSSIAMLVSIIGMFIQDYNRPWKAEQREFRDVEASLFTRQALNDLPVPKRFEDAYNAVVAARKARTEGKVKVGDTEEITRAEYINRLNRELAALAPSKERQEQEVGNLKALLASRSSFFDAAVETNGLTSAEARGYDKEVNDLQGKLSTAQTKLDDILSRLKQTQQKKDREEKTLIVAETELKRVSDDLIRKSRAAIKKEWGFGDWFRNLPILDAFASPTKIQQVTLNELTIDYNFKGVTRFDRCMTCHLGIDRPAFTRDNLRALREIPEDLNEKLKKTKETLDQLHAAFKGTPEEANIPQSSQLSLTKLPASQLTDSRINEFCAHPRQELFVGSNSKHPSEKFGCTSCHAGQGSATDFYWSSHTPNDPKQHAEWKKDHGYGAVYFWDFPMLPKRFVEASCLKCHHQVTDLITRGNRQEAPKLLRGYNLIRENGCFGCHEIHGKKNGVAIGPDMRLEPYPALDQLPPDERARIVADADNPPGGLRKVGPSLFRLSEKTNEDWTTKWIKSPRSFRPDTKMPHFYGLSNNNKEALEGTGQEKFPDAEVRSISHYLFTESRTYLGRVAELQKDKEKGQDADRQLIDTLSNKLSNKAEMAALNNEQKDELKKQIDDAKVRTAMRAVPLPLQQLPVPKDAEGKPLKEGNPASGRKLFSERGCLACHNHHGTTEPALKKKDDPNFAPPVHSEAHFGPTLSQVKEKLGTKAGDTASARLWLTHWITNPTLHSPRTKMPVTHLEPQEAADVAAWLLSQAPTELGDDWKTLTVETPDQKTLQELANVYLVRILTRSEMEQFFGDGLVKERIKELPQDEKRLAEKLKEVKGAERDKETMWYLGRKAVGRLGCFGCHDVPGFENTKPIGTALNEWGKKDPERLAFENILNYMKARHTRVDDWHDLGKIAEAQKAPDKTPYEGFFWDALDHHTREGYLHQKIKEPRSYDYGRRRAWDDRSRMPQFKFANPRKLQAESEEDLAARTEWAEELKKPAPKPRPAETDAHLKARAVKEEADAREAIMTFVLGLVGEPIPTPYLNNPSADRLAEVKGRQVLDQFNCAGCHTIRPGTYDFRLSKLTRLQLEADRAQAAGTEVGDYYFPEHNIWQGQPPADPGFLTAHGARAQLGLVNDATDKAKQRQVLALRVTLSQALAWRDPSGAVKNIRAGNTTVGVLPADVTYPPPEALQTPESLRAFLKDHGPYGGTFADLLVRYLVDRSPDLYKPDQPGLKEAAYARSAAPPLLINQGERTQPDWLFRFLRDPPRVRQMTVLRMPRFNMTDDEARLVVNYFSAVERLNNPGTGLTSPYVNLPQREPLTDPFWRERSAQYVNRLKETADPRRPGQKLYEGILAEYDSVWKEIVSDFETKVKATEKNRAAAETKFKDAKATAEKNKDDKAKDKLESARKEAEDTLAFWSGESQRLKGLAKTTTVAGLKTSWHATEAYATGGFRMMTKGICASCHEVGALKPSKDQFLAGPSLNLSNERLRPQWLKRWIANPQRYLPYTSPMPPVFARDKVQFEEFVAGTPLQQLLTVRDVLVNLPRVNALPVNQHWLFPEGKSEKEEEKKK